MRKLYLGLAVVGAILPLRYFIRFLMQNGLDMPLLLRQLFQNDISAAFGLDVIVSSVVLWLFVFTEGKRLGMKQLWVYIVCNVAVGVSMALPLFLFFREPKLKA